MSSVELVRGLDERVDATLRALGLPAGTARDLPPQPGLVGIMPDPPGTTRLRRGTAIPPAPPGTNVFAVVAEVWRRGGCQVGETYTAYGGTLVGHDPMGHILVLTRDLLVVASVPVAKPGNGLVVGIVVGGLLGPVAGCVSFLQARNVPGHELLVLFAWVPVLLVVGGALLVSPSTRRFGIGLLIGCAVTGIALSGLCSGAL